MRTATSIGRSRSFPRRRSRTATGSTARRCRRGTRISPSRRRRRRRSRDHPVEGSMAEHGTTTARREVRRKSPGRRQLRGRQQPAPRRLRRVTADRSRTGRGGRSAIGAATRRVDRSPARSSAPSRPRRQSLSPRPASSSRRRPARSSSVRRSLFGRSSARRQSLSQRPAWRPRRARPSAPWSPGRRSRFAPMRRRVRTALQSTTKAVLVNRRAGSSADRSPSASSGRSSPCACPLRRPRLRRARPCRSCAARRPRSSAPPRRSREWRCRSARSRSRRHQAVTAAVAMRASRAAVSGAAVSGAAASAAEQHYPAPGVARCC